MVFDCVIRGGSVIDGTGAPARIADLAISDGRIVRIGTVDEPAEVVIDAAGMVVAPGFIDVHTHYDAAVFWDPYVTPSSLHGVTTIVGGNCGFSVAPLEPDQADFVQGLLAQSEGMSVEVLQTAVPWDWRTYGEWLDRIEGTLAVNAAFLVGHTAVRRTIMGERSDRLASGEQIAQMVHLLEDGLDAGGIGFSSSLATNQSDGQGKPIPSRASSREEFVTLAGVVARYPGTTLESTPPEAEIDDEARDLMVDMSLAGNRPLNWNVMMITADRMDQVDQNLSVSDYAQERGGQIIALTLPGLFPLHERFVSGAVLRGIPEFREVLKLPLRDRIEAFGDPGVLERLKRGDAALPRGRMRDLLTWEQIRIGDTYSHENAGLTGRLVGDVASERGAPALDVLLDIVVADELRTGLWLPPEGDDEKSWEVRAQLWQDDRVLLGASDAGAHLDLLCQAGYPTLLLGESVRERRLLSLEKAVQLITDAPARLYGLKQRGRLVEGWHADITIFDPEQVGNGEIEMVSDMPAGGERLFVGAQGIEFVLVNGNIILERGRRTGVLAGRLLRSGRDTETVEAGAWSPATSYG